MYHLSFLNEDACALFDYPTYKMLMTRLTTRAWMLDFP